MRVSIIGGLLVAIASVAIAQSTNPVVPVDAPDPGVIRVGDTYYMVTTGDFRIRTSKDLTHWTDQGTVFNGIFNPPAWGKSDFWAPEIHRVGSQYVCYYVARDASGRLSIGAATADSPLGPWHDQPQPLVHDASQGSIDPTEFEDADGTKYLYWKSDGNATGVPCHIWVQKLSPDGLSFAPGSAPVQLLTNDQPWEASCVEAPEVVKHGDYYYLFYSGNMFNNPGYSEGVARSTSPTGPFEKAPQPVLHAGDGYLGPGHVALVDDPQGHTYMVWAAHQAATANQPDLGPRVVGADLVQWGADGWPFVNDGGTPGIPSGTFPTPSPDPGLPPPPPPPPKPAPAPTPAPAPAPKPAPEHHGFWRSLIDDVTSFFDTFEDAIEDTPGFVEKLLRTGSPF